MDKAVQLRVMHETARAFGITVPDVTSLLVRYNEALTAMQVAPNWTRRSSQPGHAPRVLRDGRAVAAISVHMTGMLNQLREIVTRYRFVAELAVVVACASASISAEPAALWRMGDGDLIGELPLLSVDAVAIWLAADEIDAHLDAVNNRERLVFAAVRDEILAAWPIREYRLPEKGDE